MRQVPVDLGQLELAFETANDDGSHWLDLDTGDVFRVDVDTENLLAEALEAANESAGSDDEVSVEQVLAANDAPDWLRRGALRWHELSSSHGRLLPVPPIDAKDSHDDLVAYVKRIDDIRLRDLLTTAIRGNGAQRRFQDVLAGEPEARQRWFAFKSVRLRERISAWLDSEGIDPVERPPEVGTPS